MGQEEQLQQQRREHFFSADFKVADPGPLFPQSWKSSISLACAGNEGATLRARPEYKHQAAAFEQVLRSASPTFDKRMEDGSCFRIYRIGALEVRTARQGAEQEKIGAIFSYTTGSELELAESAVAPKDDDYVVKVTQYIEA